jgi:hypothetical protein
LKSQKYGITIFYWVRPKCKNPTITIRLTGKFFQLGKSLEFVQYILDMCNGFGWKYSVQRVDACIDCFDFPYLESKDCVYSIAHADLEVERKKLPGPAVDVYFTGTKRTGINQWHCGEGDTRVRVYNKLLENPEYFTCYDIAPCSTVWRIEFQLRGQVCKDLQLKQKFETVEQVFIETMGQCYRRFKTGSFQLPESQVSSYLKREHTDLGKVQYHEKMAIIHYRRACELSKAYFNTLVVNPKDEEEFTEVADFEEMTRFKETGI